MGAADGAVGDPHGGRGGGAWLSASVGGFGLSLVWGEWFRLCRVEGGQQADMSTATVNPADVERVVREVLVRHLGSRPAAGVRESGIP
ncbi:MAG: hypothetical protein ACK56I_08905, partial [bacterium]